MNGCIQLVKLFTLSEDDWVIDEELNYKVIEHIYVIIKN